MRILTVLLITAGLLLGGAAKKTTPKPAAKPAAKPATKSAAKAVATRQVAKPRAKNSRTLRASSTVRASRRRATVTPRPVQQPTPERVREIQQALVDKGYLRTEASGTWGTDAVAALNRFKKEQNLRTDGKLDARTLIGLGLGPKTDSYISTMPPALAAEQAVGSQDQQ